MRRCVRLHLPLSVVLSSCSSASSGATLAGLHDDVRRSFSLDCRSVCRRALELIPVPFSMVLLCVCACCVGEFVYNFVWESPRGKVKRSETRRFHHLLVVLTSPPPLPDALILDSPLSFLSFYDVPPPSLARCLCLSPSVCVRVCVWRVSPSMSSFFIVCVCEFACTKGAPHRPASGHLPTHPSLSAAPKLHRGYRAGSWHINVEATEHPDC